MKCKNCGFESERDFEYCVNCGEPANHSNEQTVEAVSLNPAADIVLPALRDKLFLALCIFMTASCVLSLASSGMPLLNILITIFLWLTYADAQKGFANEKHLQFISGVVYANYVIVQVASIILLVCGVLLGFCLAVEKMDLTSIFISAFEGSGFSLPDIPVKSRLMLDLLIVVVLISVGVIMLVFNILMMRKIHRFAKSVYQGIMFQNPDFENPTAVRNWFYFIAACNGLNVISSITSAEPIYILTSICSLAISIIVISLMNRHIV